MAKMFDGYIPVTFNITDKLQREAPLRRGEGEDVLALLYDVGFVSRENDRIVDYLLHFLSLRSGALDELPVTGRPETERGQTVHRQHRGTEAQRKTFGVYWYTLYIASIRNPSIYL
jgi:hypothetical protein